MELFFYSCEKEAPFETLYESLDSSGKKLLISNHQRHIAQFETYKDRIIDEAIRDTITDKKIFVPRAVKAIFLEWVKEKYGDDVKFEESVFDAEDFYLLGADELNHFLQEMNVEEVSTPQSPPSPIWKKFVKPFLLLFVSIIIAIILLYRNSNYFGDFEKKRDGRLSIIRIPDRTIYINNEKQPQKTPVKNLQVPVGEVNIRIYHSDFGKRCATIDIKPNKSITLEKEDFKRCEF